MLRYFSIRQLLLTGAALFTLIFLAHLERYSAWSDRLFEMQEDYEAMKDSLSVEHRMSFYGSSYEVCKVIKKQINAKDAKTAVIVFPPREYFTKNNITFVPPEPAVFYFFTGLKSVWMSNPDAPKATHWVEVSNSEVRITPIRKPADFYTLSAPYKKYQL